LPTKEANLNALSLLRQLDPDHALAEEHRISVAQ
jgi:hypothetical protein